MSAPLENVSLTQHLVMKGVSWGYYEHTLEQIGNRPMRVAFLDGDIEIMSPLPEHEAAKRAIGRLVETLTLELRVPHKSFGSTTFKREEQNAGTEPDECYYFHDIAAVKGMKRFDPLIHRAPDLAIEVDIWNPSIPREPIYARLGVPEIWRYNGNRLRVNLLGANCTYLESKTSQAFPLLPIDSFTAFIPKMIDEDETQMTLEFSEWVRGLKRL